MSVATLRWGDMMGRIIRGALKVYLQMLAILTICGGSCCCWEFDVVVFGGAELYFGISL
jgi:phosphatidylglycerophosphate synthase